MTASTTRRTSPVPRLKPMSFFSTGNSGSGAARSSSVRISVCDMDMLPQRSAGQRRLDAAEKQPGNYESDPDHEAEQADGVDGGELADALLPQLLEVGQNADREERQDEKDHPERVGFADRGGDFGGDIRRSTERKVETDHEGHHEAEDELREALPDFGDSRLVRRDVDMVGPDVAENEGPDADENVDEHFHRSGGAEDPSRLIRHALRRRLRQDQRFGDAAAGDRRAVGLDGKSDPATSGSCHRNVCARNGRINTSTTAKTTTSEETSTGTIGRAQMAAPVAIAA